MMKFLVLLALVVIVAADLQSVAMSKSAIVEHDISFTAPANRGKYVSWVDLKEVTLLHPSHGCVTFGVKGSNSAHILLSEVSGVATNKRGYEIVLGDNDNTKSTITSFSGEDLDYFPKIGSNRDGAVLSAKETRYFWINFVDGEIAVGQGQECYYAPMMSRSMLADAKDRLYNVKYIAFAAWDTPIEFSDISVEYHPENSNPLEFDVRGRGIYDNFNRPHQIEVDSDDFHIVFKARGQSGAIALLPGFVTSASDAYVFVLDAKEGTATQIYRGTKEAKGRRLLVEKKNSHKTLQRDVYGTFWIRKQGDKLSIGQGAVVGVRVLAAAEHHSENNKWVVGWLSQDMHPMTYHMVSHTGVTPRIAAARAVRLRARRMAIAARTARRAQVALAAAKASKIQAGTYREKLRAATAAASMEVAHARQAAVHAKLAAAAAHDRVAALKVAAKTEAHKVANLKDELDAAVAYARSQRDADPQAAAAAQAIKMQTEAKLHAAVERQHTLKAQMHEARSAASQLGARAKATAKHVEKVTDHHEAQLERHQEVAALAARRAKRAAGAFARARTARAQAARALAGGARVVHRGVAHDASSPRRRCRGSNKAAAALRAAHEQAATHARAFHHAQTAARRAVQLDGARLRTRTQAAAQALARVTATAARVADAEAKVLEALHPTEIKAAQAALLKAQVAHAQAKSAHAVALARVAKAKGDVLASQTQLKRIHKAKRAQEKKSRESIRRLTKKLPSCHAGKKTSQKSGAANKAAATLNKLKKQHLAAVRHLAKAEAALRKHKHDAAQLDKEIAALFARVSRAEAAMLESDSEDARHAAAAQHAVLFTKLNKAQQKAKRLAAHIQRAKAAAHKFQGVAAGAKLNLAHHKRKFASVLTVRGGKTKAKLARANQAATAATVRAHAAAAALATAKARGAAKANKLTQRHTRAARALALAKRQAAQHQYAAVTLKGKVSAAAARVAAAEKSLLLAATPKEREEAAAAHAAAMHQLTHLQAKAATAVKLAAKFRAAAQQHNLAASSARTALAAHRQRLAQELKDRVHAHRVAQRKVKLTTARLAVARHTAMVAHLSAPQLAAMKERKLAAVVAANQAVQHASTKAAYAHSELERVKTELRTAQQSVKAAETHLSLTKQTGGSARAVREAQTAVRYAKKHVSVALKPIAPAQAKARQLNARVKTLAKAAKQAEHKLACVLKEEHKRTQSAGWKNIQAAAVAKALAAAREAEKCKKEMEIAHKDAMAQAHALHAANAAVALAQTVNKVQTEVAAARVAIRKAETDTAEAKAERRFAAASKRLAKAKRAVAAASKKAQKAAAIAHKAHKAAAAIAKKAAQKAAAKKAARKAAAKKAAAARKRAAAIARQAAAETQKLIAKQQAAEKQSRRHALVRQTAQKALMKAKAAAAKARAHAAQLKESKASCALKAKAAMALVAAQKDVKAASEALALASKGSPASREALADLREAHQDLAAAKDLASRARKACFQVKRLQEAAAARQASRKADQRRAAQTARKAAQAAHKAEQKLRAFQRTQAQKLRVRLTAKTLAAKKCVTAAKEALARARKNGASPKQLAKLRAALSKCEKHRQKLMSMFRRRQANSKKNKLMKARLAQAAKKAKLEAAACHAAIQSAIKQGRKPATLQRLEQSCQKKAALAKTASSQLKAFFAQRALKRAQRAAKACAEERKERKH